MSNLRLKTRKDMRTRHMVSGKSPVGTGGRSHTFLGFPQPNSEVRNSDTFGVLKLTLAPGKYTWEFVPEAEVSFTTRSNARAITA